MKKYCIPIFLICITTFCKAKQIEMTPVQAIKTAGEFIDVGDMENAWQILTLMPETNNQAIEIERKFLKAQILQQQGDPQGAIKLYQQILDKNPELARVRFELAVCYMQTKQWQRADWHLRLAMADDALGTDAKQVMNAYRYIVRQNKRWNVWFNVGLAPDNNINNSVAGQECVSTIVGPVCNRLNKPESGIGYNATVGGNHEFVLSGRWRWKSQANLDTNIYHKHKYDELHISAQTGPRFIWENGDVWLAGTIGRRWYGWERYNWYAGAKIAGQFDLSNKLGLGLNLQFTNNKYDLYDEFFSGQTYSANIHTMYAFSSSIYTVFKTGVIRENARSDMYSYTQPYVAVGMGVQLPYGFNVYAEPAVYLAKYDAPQWTIQDNNFAQITERNQTWRYMLAISNNNIRIWNTVPMITFAYTKRDSNIWQRQYEKASIAITLTQRF